jgi:hypothetical protein
MTITKATIIILQKYLIILNNLLEVEKLNNDKKEKILKLKAMCETIINNNNLMTEDKISRWLGFIQGIMYVYNWIDIEERNYSRKLFHKAYEKLNLEKPISITI